MIKIKKNGILHLVLLGLLLPALSNCSNINRTHVGAVAGGGSAVAGCVALGVSDPYLTGACALMGGFAGAELMYNSDYDVHNAVFVDHLNTGPTKQSYTNWYNTENRQ